MANTVSSHVFSWIPRLRYESDNSRCFKSAPLYIESGRTSRANGDVLVNILCFAVDPELLESNGGQRLVDMVANFFA